MLGHLRPYVQTLKQLLAWPYIKLGFSATGVGVFGVAMAILAALLVRLGYYQPAFWIALVAVLTDMADGEVARSRGEATPAGNYIDAIGDRLREGFLLIGLLPFAPNLVVLSLFATCLTSFAKARCGLVIIMDNRDWWGFGDHPDRAVMLVVAYLMAPTVTWPLAFMAVVTWRCFFLRARTALRYINEAESDELLPYLRPLPNSTSDKSSTSSPQT